MKNNLFNYATKELSQDAFICWLMSFAIKGNKADINLKHCAEDFIRKFIDLPESEEVYLDFEPKQQYKHIDVLLTVNNTYKIIIEDKTNTKEHDNQLIVYRNEIINDFPDFKVIGIYFKTGFQSDLTQVIESKYKIFNREDILNILDKHCEKITNNIFIDYYQYLKSFDEEIKKFKYLPISQWNWQQINGFFDYMKKNILSPKNISCNYAYIPNRAGGFYGMWIFDNTYKTIENSQYELYLQCEFHSPDFLICYKVSLQEKGKIVSNIRDRFIWKNSNEQWINVASKYNFEKPLRFGSGNTVSLGVYKSNIVNYKDAEITIIRAYNDFKSLVSELS